MNASEFTTPASCRPSLAETLESLLAVEREEGPSVGELINAVGEKGFGLIFLVLSLPSALPVPAPGYSTPFGIVIVLIAAQMILGRETLWLPRRLQAVRLKRSLTEKMIRTGARFLRRIEHLIKPRMHWAATRGGRGLIAIIIIIMAGLMILPIPLTNTVPAMVVFILGVALTEDDGLLAAGAFAIGCLAVFLYTGIVYIFITQGPDAIEGIKDWIRTALPGGAG